MRTRKQRRALAAVTFAGALVAAGTAPAFADNGVRFIDGFENPEDLAEIPSSPWVIVSSWQDNGYVSAVHKGNQRVVEVYPGTQPRADQDMELYGECPGPLTEGFYAHGISIKPGRHQTHTLYVVRHNGREAIEVFEVDGRGSQPTLTWIGCILPPDDVPLDFNLVAWVPDGDGVAVTSPGTDNVWEWDPVAGWWEVPGSQGISPTASRSPPTACGTSGRLGHRGAVPHLTWHDAGPGAVRPGRLPHRQRPLGRRRRPPRRRAPGDRAGSHRLPRDRRLREHRLQSHSSGS